MVKPVIAYDDYDKIVDDVIYLGSKLFLRMTVVLSNKYEKDGQLYREPIHKEYRYASKYSTNKLVTIKRSSFEYYLSLDKTDTKASIWIRVQDILLLRSKLSEVSSWFSDDTFAIKGGSLIVYKRKPSVIIKKLMFDKYLQFDPVVIVWENTGDQVQGIRITLGDPNEYVDLPLSKFQALLYSIQSINMYESAQLLLNYIGRPENGSNLVEFEENSMLKTSEQQEKNMTGIENRAIGKQKRSFFDKLDEI